MRAGEQFAAIDFARARPIRRAFAFLSFA